MPSSDVAAAPGPTVDHAQPAKNEAVDWDELYRAHAATVARWASRLAGPTADVDDLVQEVFMAASASHFRQEAQVTTWLYRITARTVFRWRRRNSWWSRLVRLNEEHADRWADPRNTPEATAALSQQVRLLYRVLDELSDKDREALILHELEGLTGPQIAELWGATDNAVWVRLHRARQRFEKVLRRFERQESSHAR